MHLLKASAWLNAYIFVIELNICSAVGLWFWATHMNLHLYILLYNHAHCNLLLRITLLNQKPYWVAEKLQLNYKIYAKLS